MDNIDDVIRDLAKNHGEDNLSDSQVHEVKGTLSAAYIDDILDNSNSMGTTSTEQTLTNGDLS